jgi:hypothetical protein
MGSGVTVSAAAEEGNAVRVAATLVATWSGPKDGLQACVSRKITTITIK